MRIYFLGAGVLVGLVFSPLGAMAAMVTADLTAPMGGKDYTVTGGATDLTLSNSSLTITLAQNESITITSPDTSKFTFDSASVTNYTESCTATTYSITFKKNDSGTKSFGITPIATTCANVSAAAGGGSGGTGSSGGGGGGGGGGSPTTTTTTTTTTATTATTAAPSTATATGSGSAAAGYTFSGDMAIGSEGADVTQLQAFLASDSALYPEGKITGYFGPLTQKAVKRFQEKYGIWAIGRVGPQTRAKLNEVFGGASSAESAPAETVSAPAVSAGVFTERLSLRSENEEVTLLQTFLAKDSEVYPEGLVTGYFGSMTLAAVKRFQEKYGIATQGQPGYGSVGPMTRAKLNELNGGTSSPAASSPAASEPAASPAAKTNAELIKELQDQLQALQEQLKAMQGQ